MSAEPLAQPERRTRVLVLGQSPAVLEAVTRELVELGFAVEGSVQPDRAAREFDPTAFDAVAIGGGVDEVTRTGVKRDFAARNPAIRLVDAYAPITARQVLAAFGGSAKDPLVDLAAYLARIGHDGPVSPDLATLGALHERHPAAITFEAVDVLLGRGVDLTPERIDAKLIGAGRGGYCFEQNSLFRRALEAIGFRVTPLLARVVWGLPAGSPTPPRSHMALRVEIDGVPWLADVGFGSVVPTAPLRLDTEEPQETLHDTFRVIAFGTETLVQVRRDGVWLPVYRLCPEPAQEADYEAANWYTSTHPASHFGHGLIAARTTPEARFTLAGNRLTVRRPGREPERRALDADGIEQALMAVFGLPVEAEWRPLIERAALSE